MVGACDCTWQDLMRVSRERDSHMEDVRVAAVQMTSPVGQVDENLSTMREYVSGAQSEGVDIICFPELNIPGYYAHKDLYDLAEPIPGDISEKVVGIAAEGGMTVLAGMAEMGKNGAVYNTQIVATPQGLTGKYRKLHVNESEISYFSPGYDLPVFHHSKVTFGIEICYDSHFPELSTSLALKGCELLFFPHASPGETFEEKRERWLKYMPARGYDNSLFVVVSNRVGDNGSENVKPSPGSSMMISPAGDVMVEAKPYQEDMIMADLRTQDLVQLRKGGGQGGWNFFLRYRRPELYGTVVEKTV